MVSFNNYSRYFRYGESYRLQEEALVNFLKPLKFDTILEIGCSFGRITKVLNEAFHPKRFLSVDPANEIDRYLEAEFIQTDAMMLPETEKFDLVIAVEVLMHIKKYEPLLEKMKRLSNKYVVHLDYWEEKPTWPLEPDYNWLHNYSGHKTTISKNQAIFYHEIIDRNTQS